MEASVYVNHSKNCPHKADRFYRRCKCRKWFYVAGSRQRISARTRSWSAADKKLANLKQQHEQPEDTGHGGNRSPAEVNPDTVREAVSKFLENKRQEGLSTAWERKLKRELLDFAAW